MTCNNHFSEWKFCRKALVWQQFANHEKSKLANTVGSAIGGDFPTSLNKIPPKCCKNSKLFFPPCPGGHMFCLSTGGAPQNGLRSERRLLCPLWPWMMTHITVVMSQKLHTHTWLNKNVDNAVLRSDEQGTSYSRFSGFLSHKIEILREKKYFEHFLGKI